MKEIEQKMKVELNLDIEEIESINNIEYFKKNDPEKLQEISLFVDDILNEAKQSAEMKNQQNLV